MWEQKLHVAVASMTLEETAIPIREELAFVNKKLQDFFPFLTRILKIEFTAFTFCQHWGRNEAQSDFHNHFLMVRPKNYLTM